MRGRFLAAQCSQPRFACCSWAHQLSADGPPHRIALTERANRHAGKPARLGRPVRSGFVRAREPGVAPLRRRRPASARLPNRIHPRRHLRHRLDPSAITVPPGMTVCWTNTGQISHTVTSDTGLFDVRLAPPGGSFSYTFNDAGQFPYHCSFHADDGRHDHRQHRPAASRHRHLLRRRRRLLPHLHRPRLRLRRLLASLVATVGTGDDFTISPDDERRQGHAPGGRHVHRSRSATTRPSTTST